MDTNSDSDIDVNENFDSNDNFDNVDNNEEFIQYGGRDPNYGNQFDINVASIYILDADENTKGNLQINDPNKVSFSEFQQFFKDKKIAVTDAIYSKVDKDRYMHGSDNNLLPGLVYNTKVEYVTKLLEEGYIGRWNADSEDKGSNDIDQLAQMAPGYTEGTNYGVSDKYWALFVELLDKSAPDKKFKFNTDNDLLFIFNDIHTSIKEDITPNRKNMKFEEMNKNTLQLLNVGKLAISGIAPKINNILEKNHEKARRVSNSLISSIIIVRNGCKHISDFTSDDIKSASVDYNIKANNGFLDAYKKFIFVNKILLNYDNNFKSNIEDIFTNYNENLKKIIENLHDKIIKVGVDETSLVSVDYALISETKKIIEKVFVKKIGDELYKNNINDLKSTERSGTHYILNPEDFDNFINDKSTYTKNTQITNVTNGNSTSVGSSDIKITDKYRTLYNSGIIDLLATKNQHDFINELDHYNLEIKGKNEIKITIFLIIYCAFIIHSEFKNKIVNIKNDSYIIALSEIFYKYNKVLETVDRQTATDYEKRYTLLEFLIDMIKLIYNDFGALMINRLTYANDDEKKEYEKIFIEESERTDSFKRYMIDNESIDSYKNKSIDNIKTELQAKKGFIFTQLNDIHINNKYINNYYHGFFKLTNITSTIDSALFLQNIFKIENLEIPKDICNKKLYVGNGQMFFLSHGLFPRYFNLDARFSTGGKGLLGPSAPSLGPGGFGVFLHGTMTDSIKSPDNRNILGIQMRNMNKQSYNLYKGFIRTTPEDESFIENTNKSEVKDDYKARLHDHIKHIENDPLYCKQDYHTNYLNAYFNDFYEKFVIVGYSLKGNPTIYSIFKPYLESISGKFNDLTGILVDNNGNGDIKIMETNTNNIKTDLYRDRNVLQKATSSGERRVLSVVKQFIIKMTEEFKKGSSVSIYVTPIKNTNNTKFNILTFGGDKDGQSTGEREEGVTPTETEQRQKEESERPAEESATPQEDQSINETLNISNDDKEKIKDLVPVADEINKFIDKLDTDEKSKNFFNGLMKIITDALKEIKSDETNKVPSGGGSLTSKKQKTKTKKLKKKGGQKTKKK
jgi:hypothetical protein